MVQQCLTYMISKVGDFFAWLTTLSFVEGVSIGSFLIALFIIGVLIRNFLYTAR